LKEEEVILSIIVKECKEKGSIFEERVFKMAQLLNINSDNCHKIRNKLIETGKIGKNGNDLFLV